MLVVLFGKRGTGKTYLIAETAKTLKGPVLMLDFLGNFNDVKGFKTQSTESATKWLLDYKSQDKEKICILTPSNVDLSVDAICDAAWVKGNCTLVIDEVDMISYSGCRGFDYVVRYGRNRGIHLLLASRRPAEISRNITAGANAIYIFQTQEPRDIEYYSKTLVGEHAEKLMTLPRHHGVMLDYDRERIGIFQVNSDGEVFFVDNLKN